MTQDLRTVTCGEYPHLPVEVYLCPVGDVTHGHPGSEIWGGFGCSGRLTAQISGRSEE